MKTVITSLLIFTMIIGLGITQFCITENYMNTLNHHIDILDNAVQNHDSATLETEVNKTLEIWAKMRFVLCLMIKHEYVFEIDTALTELLNFSHSFDVAEATLSVSKAKAAAQCITETSSFILENII